ncbi:MAG: hypothetical protein ACP5KA_05335 [Desulfurococcaceae archaeon]
MSQPEQQDVLGQVVKSLEFKKLSAGVLSLPALFAAPAFVLLMLGITKTVNLLLGGGGVVEELVASQMLTWGSVLLFGYTASSMAASYLLMRDLREHFYKSALTTYYWKIGVDYTGALHYLKSMIERSLLPSPATALLLAFLSGGVSYPVLLCLAERALRRHAASEEEVLLGKKLTKEYTWLNAAVDLALAVVTMGLYVAYMGYRVARGFNKHVDDVHGRHPEPPEAAAVGGLGEIREPTPRLVVGLYLTAVGLSIVVAYAGILPSPYVMGGAGLLLATTPLVMREKGFTARVLVAYGLLYLAMFSGFLAGVAGYEVYRFLLNVAVELRALRAAGPLLLFFVIFVNNFSISAGALVPLIGSIALINGAYTAGAMLGVLVMSGAAQPSAILVLVYPHALLEVFAYAVLLAASSFYGSWRKLATYSAAGVVLLAAAALVEVATMVAAG